ncbi:unnamed protein product [Cylicocyclus nassatus]|uniref:Tetratricopeptide repeat protein 21B n=1 Tax=Cylicocyclus nassatus TaxID=53992 RepID=A0AA36GTS0_CYLNA|nr:unnamed protein product [Cylicocyclus nassatus]
MDYSESLLKAIASIHFYLREGYYGTALKICNGPEGGTQHVQFLKGIALNLSGKAAEAMRLLEPLRTGDYALGALYALKQSHHMAENPDRQSLLEIESEISSLNDAPDLGQYVAAEALFFIKDYAKAKLLVDKITKSDPENAMFACLAGWIEIYSGRDQKSTMELFDKAIGGHYLDGYVGKMTVLSSRQLANDMKALAKEALAVSFGYIPFHIESARACLLAKEWNNMVQALQNSNIVESDNILIHFLLAVHCICSTGTKIESVLNELKTALDATESENHALYASVANALYRMAARNRTVLAFCRELLAQANRKGRHAQYVVDELRVAISFEDVREVTAKMKELMNLDTDDPYATLAATLSNLMSGKLNEAADQLTFMKEANPHITESAVYHFASAVIAKYKDNSFEKFMQMTNDAIIAHLNKIQTMPFGVEYLRQLDSDFIMGLIYQILDYAPIMPLKSPNEVLKTAERLLNLLVDNSPGISQVYYLLARCFFLHSDWDAADRMINQCLEKNETVTDAYLLRAEIKLMNGQVADADSCLNTGLSFNFAIRESSIFHLIKAKVHKQKNELEKAADLLKAGLKLPQKERSTNLLSKMESTDSQRISIQLELIDCLQSLKQIHEAERVMKEAMAQWKGKPEEEQLLLMNAQIKIRKGDVDGALAMLGTVQPGQPNYYSARMKMAEIYLEEKQDKTMFTLCYRELLKSAPTSATYALLGDAYMSVQEPEKAIEAYETALKMSNKDMGLTEKIGEAYVLCHLYSKAVNFYESVMNSTKDKRMRLKLADLLHQLGNTEKCMRILRQPLDEEPNPIEPATISAHVQYLKLLAEVQFEGGKHTEALNDLTAAKNLQMKLLTKSDSAANQEVKKEISKILCSQAEIYSNAHDHKMVIERYKEALTFYETDIKTILALASRYMTINKLAECKQMCEMALSIDKNNDEATLMVADMLYTNNDTDKAIVHFAQLLEKYPNHYHALARCLELAWRAGHVDQADKYLKKALENNPRASVDAGYNYCKGLHEWYSGEPNAALQAFNRARRDLEWGERALYNMIEIVLNPDNEIIGGEVLDAEDRGDNSDREMAAKTAERFLKEVTFKNNNSKYILMENSILVASGVRANIQRALDRLLPIVGNDGEKVSSVGAVLVVARAYMLMKQTPKAKALLKRVVGHSWTLEDADYLEKCWLLLADLYINQNKSEQANTILRTVLQHNALFVISHLHRCALNEMQSSIKAFEFLGYLREREQKFNDAAANYDDAWKLSRMRNPSIGYKLAYNLLKCKRLFDCIEVCHHVLKLYPTYPKIKKEIMDKARMSIRS